MVGHDDAHGPRPVSTMLFGVSASPPPSASRWDKRLVPNPRRAMERISLERRHDEPRRSDRPPRRVVHQRDLLRGRRFHGGRWPRPAIAAQWNGSTWSPQSISLPSGDKGAELVGTSCTTPSVCMAVGFQLLSRRGSCRLAYSWNGTSWTETTSISNLGLSYLYAVSCAGLTFCAASAYEPGQDNVVAIWNGSSWSLAPNVPTPSTGDSSLYGVSCFSPTSCTAVGTTGDSAEA